MKPYHKIQTLFLRSPESNFKQMVEGQWARPEFEMLKDIEWKWTEKIDGTNIRIIWDGAQVLFKGKSDDAQIPVFLEARLREIFTAEKLSACFPENSQVCLYGEGFGDRIQKGKNYLVGTTGFILFDCRVGNWWFTRESLENVAMKLEIPLVPLIGQGPLEVAIQLVKAGFKSTIAQNKEYPAEGLILKPRLELFDRAGERIIAKLKSIDFLKG